MQFWMNSGQLLKVIEKCTISILEPKNYPEVLSHGITVILTKGSCDQYCEKILGMLPSKSFFSVRIGVTALPSLLPYR